MTSMLDHRKLSKDKGAMSPMDFPDNSYLFGKLKDILPFMGHQIQNSTMWTPLQMCGFGYFSQFLPC
jgi:hypothetical protein